MTEEERKGLENLRMAMEADDLLLLEEFPPAEDNFHSAHCLDVVNSLRKREHKNITRMFDAVWKRVVAAILAVILLSSSMMSISAVREPITGFLIKVQGRLLEIFFQENERVPEEIEKIYTLSYLPEECEWLTQYIGKKDVTTTWISDDLTITLMQTTMDSRLFVNNELARFDIRVLTEKNIAVIGRFDMNIYFWNTREYAYHLMVQGRLSEEECVRIMESLTEDTEKIMIEEEYQ